MPPHVTLTGVASDDLLAWLPECIALVREELALHPLRPQPSAMLPYRPPLHHLYLFARRLARWYVGIYEVLPETAPPFGIPLMLLAGEMCDTPAAPGELHVGIWRNVHFPLDIPEIAWLIEERFPSKPAVASPLAPYTRPAELGRSAVVTTLTPTALPPVAPPGHRLPPVSISAEPSAEPSAEAVADVAAEPAPPLRRTGMRPSTEWLIAQLAALPQPADPEPFYQDWMDLYRATEGLNPRDSARSFSRTLDTVYKHLGHTRRRQRR